MAEAGQPGQRIRDHFLAALTRRREALPEAARARVDTRMEQLRARPITQTVARIPCPSVESPLAALVRELEARTHIDAHETDTGAPRELKSAGHFREQLTDLSVEKHIEAALAQWPENAGPLNSHFLALQALDALRGSAPRYLRRFVAYLDTLLWLEGVQDGSTPAAGKTRQRRKR